MGIKRSKLRLLLQAIMCLSAISFSNPVDVTPFSEIQIKDQSHFTIEFDARMEISKPYPANLDSIFLYCGGDSRPPLDLMQQCVQPIDLDTNGIALITEKNFPNFLIKPGKLYFGYKQNNYHSPLTIENDSFPKTFVSGYSDPVCCGYMNGQCTMTCRSPIYKETQCPSLGIRNSGAVIIISGQIRDYNDSIPYIVNVSCTSKSDSQIYYASNGNFYFDLADCSNEINLKFTDQNESLLKDTTIGPFTLGTSVSISVKVPVTSSKIPRKSDMKSSVTRILSASIAKGIVFALSGTSVSQGAVQIYSNDGKFIRKLLFNSHGAGTYTVNWDGKNERNQSVPSGMYTVRILIGKESICTGILNL